MIKVLLAEDQTMVRGALAALLELEDDINVINNASDGREALLLLEQALPDVLVTDIEMPHMTGIELAQMVQKNQQFEKVKVIILTTFARTGFLRRAMDANVSGYLLKDAPAEQLAGALRKVNRGEKVIDPELMTAAWGEQDPLTDRERQVLRLAAEGVSNSDIAKAIFLAEGTVRNYLSEAMSKLGAVNRVEAARIARHKGWL